MKQYLRHSTMTIEEFMSLAKSGGKKTIVDDKKINLESLRLKTFVEKGTACVSCGAKATYAAIERDKIRNEALESWHINLYATLESGKDVLMTKDHIVPKSKGGRDTLENMQTMCSRCNSKKGSKT